MVLSASGVAVAMHYAAGVKGIVLSLLQLLIFTGTHDAAQVAKACMRAFFDCAAMLRQLLRNHMSHWYRHDSTIIANHHHVEHCVYA